MPGWTEQPVSIELDGWLRGTIVRPAGPGPAPGVLIVAGSGPVDRDGNVPGLANDGLKHLAHALAERGVASLRADKRGVGGSTWDGLDEADLRFGAYVRDAVAWAEALADEPGIAGVSLLGHSEGALIVSLAARRAKAARVVLVAGVGTPAGAAMERQFAEGGLPGPLRASLHRILGQLAAGQLADDVPPELTALFRPSVQPYLMSWLPIDPAVALSRVEAPVLVVQGTTDIQVRVADARILAAARPGTDLAIIEGMNHVFRAAPPDRAGNVATYRDPALPLHPAVADVVAGFLRGA